MIIKLPDTAEFAAVKSAAKKLASAGFPTRLIGGSVRDLLLGRPPADIDLVTTATPEKLAALFPECKLVGASFGVTILKVNGFSFECATAREERGYMDGRHPTQVKYTTSFEVDAARRDFTINAMSCDLDSGEVFDYHGGIDDLKRGVIRTVGDPGRRFDEDYLRMLRAIRFAGRFNFALDPATGSAISERAATAREISGERIASELNMMLESRDPAGCIARLEQYQLLPQILPEVAVLRGVSQPPDFHTEGDVLTHTLLMLKHLVLPNRLLAWSVLLHDLGKARTRSVDPDGRIRFFGHESVGAAMAEKLLTRLHFPVDEIEIITHAIANHMRFAAVQDMRRAKLLRLIAEPNFPLELELHRLDCLCSNSYLQGFIFLLDACRTAPTQLPKAWISGQDLIRLGGVPGKKFGVILSTLFDAQITGEISSREDALKLAAKLLEK